MTLCARCEREVIPHRDWSEMTPAARRAAHAAGKRETRAARLCVGCYQAARRAGTLEQVRVNASIDPTRKCTRCGITGVVARLGVCADCADVTTDLRETGRWAEPVPA